jgi:hypothetical protein
MNDETDNRSLPVPSPEAPMNPALESQELLRRMAASTQPARQAINRK